MNPLWVRLSIHPVDNVWAAMIVADDAAPPLPGGLKRTGFFGDTLAEAKAALQAYLLAQTAGISASPGAPLMGVVPAGMAAALTYRAMR